MTVPCPGFEPLLIDRAAGALDPGGVATLEAHLEGCAACRAEAAALASTLELARLPPPGEAERAVLRDLDVELATRLAVARRRRTAAGGFVAGLAVAAAAAGFLLAPALLRKAPEVAPEEVAAWTAAGSSAGATTEGTLVADAGTSTEEADASDVALDALDAAFGVDE